MHSDAFSTSARRRWMKRAQKKHKKKQIGNGEGEKIAKHQKQINQKTNWMRCDWNSKNGNSRHTDDNNELVCLVDWWKSQMSRKMPFIVCHIYRWWVSLWYAMAWCGMAWHGMEHIYFYESVCLTSRYLCMYHASLSPPFVNLAFLGRFISRQVFAYFTFKMRVCGTYSCSMTNIIADQKKSNEECVCVCTEKK